MIFESIKELIGHLDQAFKDDDIGEPYFSDADTTTYPLVSDGFKQIDLVESNRNIAFVDGGNQEIIGGPNFSIQLNRVCFSIWQGSEQILQNSLQQRTSFLSATNASFSHNQINYSSTVLPIGNYHLQLPEEHDLFVSAFDESLRFGMEMADIHRIPSICRRFSELALANEVVKNVLKKGDVLVMDGTLHMWYPNEWKYYDPLVKAAKEKQVTLMGISKTCGLFTTSGLSLVGALDYLSSVSNVVGAWYFPIADISRKDHSVFLMFAKFHSASGRIFRTEIERGQFKEMDNTEISELLAQLVNNSRDFTLPGYPYGLIDVDRFARVSTSELPYYRQTVEAALVDMGLWDKYNRHVKARDLHDILNSLG